ncbi:hypothetical protein ACFPYI_18450 [Halomarina salina]|uniref:CHAT domain-containing protein n=1 Tax=Halomarina salina TaxID=1872699 RepID=A0ABD5RT39_9EURY|nr:hypothetical protein [Halomarina salina]
MTFVAIERGPEGQLRVRDSIERRRCDLFTDREVSPRPVDGDLFDAPVDAAVAVDVAELTFPEVVETYVRDHTGTVIHQVRHFERHDLPEGEFGVELCSPIKLYLRVRGPLAVDSDGDTTSISLAETGEVLVGARSYHERPAATITTTTDPADVMTAVSHLGSALKTTTPERSFPTLRGHPPALELGDELDVPDGLVLPDTGVRIEIPPTLEASYVVAPLAYYLGAEVVAGSEPRLVADGVDHALATPDESDDPHGFERGVERTLKQVHFLDCIVRTEGYYPVDLHERSAVEPELPFDLSATYDRSLPEQLRAYLAVPFESLEPHMPTWKLTSHVAPTPSNLETLPYLVDDLSVIRTPNAREITLAEAQSAAIESFMSDGATRSKTPPTPPRLVRPERTDSLEQAWVAPDVPIGASKVSAAAFRNRLNQEPTDGDLSIAVICNDQTMLSEHQTASDVYGSRESLPFDVTVHRDASTADLAAVFQSDVDFVHYIGHVDERGFRCHDGHLDANALAGVGIDAFFLNACTSYQQGMALIEAGAVGGVVTVDDVVNTGATAVGRMLARMLNAGFPLQSALDVASDESLIGAQYLVVGDGNTEIAQSEGGVTFVLRLERQAERPADGRTDGGVAHGGRADETGDDCGRADGGAGDAVGTGCEPATSRAADDDVTYHASFQLYPNRLYGMGSLGRPVLDGLTQSFLFGSTTPDYEIRRSELRSLLEMSSCPVYLDGECFWSSGLLDAEF